MALAAPVQVAMQIAAKAAAAAPLAVGVCAAVPMNCCSASARILVQGYWSSLPSTAVSTVHQSLAAGNGFRVGVLTQAHEF